MSLARWLRAHLDVMGWIRARRYPMRLKLGLLLGVVAALAVALPSAVHAFSLVRDVRARLATEHLAIAEAIGTQVESHVLHTQRELAMLATTPGIVAAAFTGDAELMTAYLAAAGSVDPNLTALVAVDAQARVLAISLADKSIVDLDLSERDFIRETLQEGRAAVSSPSRGPSTGLPIVSLAVPIRATDGRIVGALLGTLSLAGLSDNLNSISVGQDGFANLFDRHGTILTHRDRDRILTKVSDRNLPVLEALAGRATAGETIDREGVPIFAAAVPLESLGWVVQVRCPIEEAFAPLWPALWWDLLMAVIAFVSALLVGLVAGRWLTMPLARLAHAAERLGEGDGTVSLPRSSTAEIAMLAEAFDRARESLAAREVERERAEAAEREQARLAGVLLAARTARHELNNRLALTVGYSELLVHNGGLPPELQPLAEEILRGATEAAAIVDQLGHVTRIQEVSWGSPDDPTNQSTIDLASSTEPATRAEYRAASSPPSARPAA